MTTQPEPHTLTLGKRIHQIRRARHLTQREVARRTGLAEPFLSRIENERAEPSLATLKRLTAAMDVTLADLLELEPGRFKSTCPVSHSGRCIAELIYQPGPRRKVIGELVFASAPPQILRRSRKKLEGMSRFFDCGAIQNSGENIFPGRRPLESPRWRGPLANREAGGSRRRN